MKTMITHDATQLVALPIFTTEVHMPISIAAMPDLKINAVRTACLARFNGRPIPASVLPKINGITIPRGETGLQVWLDTLATRGNLQATRAGRIIDARFGNPGVMAQYPAIRRIAMREAKADRELGSVPVVRAPRPPRAAKKTSIELEQARAERAEKARVDTAKARLATMLAGGLITPAEFAAEYAAIV